MLDIRQVAEFVKTINIVLEKKIETQEEIMLITHIFKENEFDLEDLKKGAVLFIQEWEYSNRKPTIGNLLEYVKRAKNGLTTIGEKKALEVLIFLKKEIEEGKKKEKEVKEKQEQRKKIKPLILY